MYALGHLEPWDATTVYVMVLGGRGEPWVPGGRGYGGMVVGIWVPWMVSPRYIGALTGESWVYGGPGILSLGMSCSWVVEDPPLRLRHKSRQQ